MSKFLTHTLIFKIIELYPILFSIGSYSLVSNSNNLISLAAIIFRDFIKKINTSNFDHSINDLHRNLHRIAILRYFDFTKKKKGEKILQKNISNFNQFPIPPMAQFIHKLSKSSPNQYQDTCVSHFRIEASVRFNFLETKIYTFSHTHTHTHTHYERMHTKSYPLSRSVVALFSPSLVLFRLVIAIYRRKSLPFCFSNSEPRVHADFYRVSSLVCLDAGSKNRSLRHLSICIYLLRGRRIFMRRERREFVRGIIFFSFVFFRLLTRLLLLFSSGDENHRSLGKLLEIL